MSTMNTSYASPSANAVYAKVAAVAPEGVISRLIEGANAWTVVLSLLAAAVVYDQSMNWLDRKDMTNR